VCAGADPQGYASDPALHEFCAAARSSREWLEATAATAHPDVVAQLAELFDSPRCGDILLFAAPGWHFSDKMIGGHGAIEREEMIVPLYYSGPGITPGAKIAAGRQADLVPTVLDLMGLSSRLPRLPRLDGASLAGQLRGTVVAGRSAEARSVIAGRAESP
jgi:arylsulfatase A-like enzyme